MTQHLLFSEHLTPAVFDRPIRETFLGQAHIAGTGPEGKTCRECVFWHVWKWDNGGRSNEPAHPGYFNKDNPEKGLGLKKALCNRPIANKAHRRVPHEAKACRLFEENSNPPPAVKQVER